MHEQAVANESKSTKCSPPATTTGNVYFLSIYGDESCEVTLCLIAISATLLVDSTVVPDCVHCCRWRPWREDEEEEDGVLLCGNEIGQPVRGITHQSNSTRSEDEGGEKTLQNPAERQFRKGLNYKLQ